ncbi:MAG: EF-hand domain-containing protein [Alphaproteobacteria bacterium]|nr:EF-hand domain-containing protein [Alphaproteobacteria bacterium]MBL6936554.1 EF-hand domain-containing protein [Alphaproteobacteria bacterium]MBL7098395.1 EF-hand domain-containing protein [Alphaproteobacteria bacterium]
MPLSKNTKIALLLGAAVLLGGSGLAMAHMDGPPPPDGPMTGLLHRGRLADRLLAEYDTNKDGKITRAEYNNVLGARFAAITHGKGAMTEDQFMAIHQDDFNKHTAEMFRRIDWNGDGKLTLEEFTAPQRAHFQMMDRDGTGRVSCNPVRQADDRPSASGHGPGGFADHGGSHRGGSFGDRGGFGRAAFCHDADLGRDGTVTRAEFDTFMTKQFQSAVNGSPAMTLAQFTALQQVRYREMNDRMFKRLDKDGDGTLTLAEFAAPALKLFARLDRNNDGVITADEMKPHFRGLGGGRHHRDRGDHG